MTIKQGDVVRNIHWIPGIPIVALWCVLCVTDDGLMKLEPFNSVAERTDPQYWRDGRFSFADFEKAPSERPATPVPLPTGQAPDAEAPPATAGAQPSFDEQIAIRQAEIKSLRQAAKDRAAKDADLAAELAFIRAAQERVQRRNDLLYADQELARATTALLAEIARLNNGGVNQPAATLVSQRAAELQPLAKRHGYKLAAAGTLHVLTAL